MTHIFPAKHPSTFEDRFKLKVLKSVIFLKKLLKTIERASLLRTPFHKFTSS